MISIISWLICGYIAGNVAMWLLPPKAGETVPGLHIIGFGVAGSVVGGFAYSAVYGNAYSPAGLIWSCIGAAIVVAAWRWLQDAEPPATGGNE